MANKVASKRWIYSNFYVGNSSNECATKTEILRFGLYITNDSSYASNQLVREEDIYPPAWTYSFSVSNWDKNVGESGGTTSSISISSSKSRLGTTESVGWSIDSSTVPSWITWNSSDMTFTVASNSSTSSRTADIYFEQDESGKRDYARVTQAEATPTTTYTFSVNPYKVNVGFSGGSGSVTITSYKTVDYITYDVDYSIDSSTLPSWVSFNKSTSTFTIQSITSTVGRTTKVYFDQDESGKRDYAEITQTGYTPPVDTYVFTWFDGRTSDLSASFPWNFSTTGAAANIPVVSTKNGSSQSWSVSSKPSWITTSTTSSRVTIRASDNSGSARSGTIVLTQSGSNKTLRINVTQDAKPAENVYVFTITPNTYDVPYSGASFIPRTVSTKNGSKIGYSLTSGETDWVVVTIDSKVTVEILKNTTSSTRSTTLVFTQNESGKTQSIKITQSGQQDEYILSMWPESNTSGSYPADAQNTNIEVRSLRNGQKHQIGVKSQPLWCTAYISRSDDSGIYYIDLAIQGNSMIISREGTIVFEQEDSGKTTSYTVSQSGSIASQDNKLTITSLTYDVAYLFPPGQVPVEGDTAYLAFLIPNTFTWKTSSGLNINRGVAYAGNICNIYVSENSRYKLVKSFKLQTGKQTVNI